MTVSLSTVEVAVCMSKLPRLTARQIVAALEKAGFPLARQSGSHMIYKNAEGKRVTVPFHASKISSSEGA